MPWVISTTCRDGGHRLCVFDPVEGGGAVRAGAHATFGTVVCIEFCVGYEDESVRSPPANRTAAARWHERSSARGGTSGPAAAARRSSGSAVVSTELRKMRFCCSGCGTALAGDTRKKAGNGCLFCQPAFGWVALYAPTCFVCGTKIDGDRVGTKALGRGASARHPACKRRRRASRRRSR